MGLLPRGWARDRLERIDDCWLLSFDMTPVDVITIADCSSRTIWSPYLAPRRPLISPQGLPLCQSLLMDLNANS